MYNKLGQACVTNWGNLVLLQIGQNLLQIGAGITNHGDYYNLGHNKERQYNTTIFKKIEKNRSVTTF